MNSSKSTSQNVCRIFIVDVCISVGANEGAVDGLFVGLDGRAEMTGASVVGFTLLGFEDG